VCNCFCMHMVAVVDKVQDQLESAKPGPLVDDVVCIYFIADLLSLLNASVKDTLELFGVSFLFVCRSVRLTYTHACLNVKSCETNLRR